MVERKTPTEHKFGSQWVVYGQGVGLKTQDLQMYEQAVSPSLKVLRGISIGDSHFKSLLEINNATAIDQEFDIFENHIQIPIELEMVNKTILTLLPKSRPIMVRSSALDERGGSGIYTSDFFITTGNPEEDLSRLTHTQKVVYSDFFTTQANHYRENLPVDSEARGMGLLIQSIVGDEHEGHFMPTLSGVLTTVNGQPLLRLVMGLGTSAVDMGEALVLKGEYVDIDEVINSLHTLKSADAIHMESGELRSIPINQDMVGRAIGQSAKLRVLLEEWKEGFNAGQPDYLEFSITESEDRPIILQASPDEIKPGIPELGMPSGVVICEGTDVVNTGERRGRGIIWFGRNGQSPSELELIRELNKTNSNFLLLARDTAFSRSTGRPLLELQHFSNAAGVVEIQYVREKQPMPPGMLSFDIDHTRGRGGAHFTEICKREDILFLGHTVRKTDDNLTASLGRPTDKIGSFSGYWDVDFLMSNSMSGGRVELLGEVERPEYSPGEIDGWAREFWYHANELEEMEEVMSIKKISGSFYEISHLLSSLSRVSPIGYQPFDLTSLQMETQKMNEIALDLQIVLDNIDDTESAITHEMYGLYEEFRLEMYLKKLLDTVISS